MFQANHAPRPGSLTLATTAGQDDPAAAYANGVAPAVAPSVLPPFVFTSSVFFNEDADWRLLDDITLPGELENAVDRRKLHFCLGRLCAGRALQLLNPPLRSMPLTRDAAGGPCWPDGITGSITHANGFASAAVAWTRDAASLGLDVERTMPSPQALKVARVIASDEELAIAERAMGDVAKAATVVFCAKEAVFKALYPLVRRRFGYAEVRLTVNDPASRTGSVRLPGEGPFERGFRLQAEGQFDVRLLATLSASFPSATVLRGRYASVGEWVHAGLAVPAAHEGHGGAASTANSHSLRS
jgi:4'-phosphopantetheinyl transferase EntD